MNKIVLNPNCSEVIMKLTSPKDGPEPEDYDTEYGEEWRDLHDFMFSVDGGAEFSEVIALAKTIKDLAKKTKVSTNKISVEIEEISASNGDYAQNMAELGIYQAFKIAKGKANIPKLRKQFKEADKNEGLNEDF